MRNSRGVGRGVSFMKRLFAVWLLFSLPTASGALANEDGYHGVSPHSIEAYVAASADPR